MALRLWFELEHGRCVQESLLRLLCAGCCATVSMVVDKMVPGPLTLQLCGEDRHHITERAGSTGDVDRVLWRLKSTGDHVRLSRSRTCH